MTATEWSDYAAQPEIRRAHTATCANAEKINELVTVVGYKPYDVTVEVPARGRRPGPSLDKDGPETARRRLLRLPRRWLQARRAVVQRRAGEPHPTGTSPRLMTVTPHPSVQEDIDSFLKFGKVKHGEWYLEGEAAASRAPLYRTVYCSYVAAKDGHRPICHAIFFSRTHTVLTSVLS